MKNIQTFAVFGLGKYGTSVAKELVDSGAEVLAVDIDEEKVNGAINEIPYCKCADITDAQVIKQLGIANVDVVIIAMSENLENSIMATVLCKEIGVKNVIVKCSSEFNCNILSKVGADYVVFPEKESGIRLAKNLLKSGVVDILDLAEGVSMVELEVRPEWIGKSLLELNLRKKYSFNVVAIINNRKVCVDINPEKPLKENDKLVVIANTNQLKKF